MIHNSKAILIILALMIVTEINSILPWWSFVVPVFAFGILTRLTHWKIKSFSVGFIAGFIIWFGFNFYFDQLFKGTALHIIGQLIAFPSIIILTISGLIGGALTGLAFCAGRTLISEK